jgi:lipopolysaccharide/colanic/teichoic acid biosynthesis glycosyltransferase
MMNEIVSVQIQTKTLDGYFISKDLVAKRCFDLIGSSLGIILALPLMVFLAAFIKRVSPGPVFFKQTRIGRGGKLFTCYKFRTMHPNCGTKDHRNYLCKLINCKESASEKGTPMTKIEDKSKIIPLGVLIRSLGIDELPQLFNVIKGEMSLVGPRPAIPYEVNEYRLWHKQRLDAIPGLTGLWQVSGKNKLSFKEMIRLDLQYVQQQSIWLDIWIILKTPQAVLMQAVEHIIFKLKRLGKGGQPND